MIFGRSRLAVCCVALLVALAGCNGGSSAEPEAETEMVETETPSPTATPTTTTGTPTVTRIGVLDVQGQFETEFIRIAADNDIRVTSLERDGSILRVRFAGDPDSIEETRVRAGRVGGVFGFTVQEVWEGESSWEVDGMVATAVRPDGSEMLRYWTPAYAAREAAVGEMTGETFGQRAAQAIEQPDPDGSYPEPTEELDQFRSSVDGEANITVERIDRYGDTVHLTVTLPTDNGSRTGTNVGYIVGHYARLAQDGWDVAVVDLTVRRQSGDRFGWYRIERDVAIRIIENDQEAVQELLDTFVAEEDRLDGDR